jgi:hypothetical protein
MHHIKNMQTLLRLFPSPDLVWEPVALGVKIDQLKHCSIVGPLEIGLGISSEA